MALCLSAAMLTVLGMVNVPFPASRINALETAVETLNATDAIILSELAQIKQDMSQLKGQVTPPPPQSPPGLPPAPPPGSPQFTGNCKGLKASGTTASGWYKLQATASSPIYTLYCDMINNGGGWTQVMRGIGGDSMVAYTTSDADLNIPTSGDLSTLESSSVTWKLSSETITAFQTSDALGAGDQAATYWVEGAGSGCGGYQHFYHDCSPYVHTSDTNGATGCGKPSQSAAMTNKACGSGQNVGHMGVGCPGGACTHSNSNSNRGWYFSNCQKGSDVNCDMNFWVR